MERRGDEVHITTDEARGGRRGRHVRNILVISLVLVIVALSAVWITGAALALRRALWQGRRMNGALFPQFAVSTVMVVLCVAIHGFGLFGLNRAVRSEAAVERLRRLEPWSPRGLAFTLAIVLAMLALHGLEIWSFALTYVAIGAVNGLEEALYFSTISYSTVGYNDTHIAVAWRLVGAFESIMGMLLLGWSTAFFFRMIGRIDPH